MEPIAVNVTTVTKRLFYEAMGAAASYRRAFRKAFALLAVLWLILAGVTMAMGMGLSAALFELFVLGVITLWLGFFYPRGQYKRAYRTLENTNGGIMERTICFYDKKCVVQTPAGEHSFRYEDAAAVQRTAHLLIVTFHDRSSVMAELSGFQTGSAAMVEKQINLIKEINL